MNLVKGITDTSNAVPPHVCMENKCNNNFYNFLIGIYTKENKENRTETKHVQNTKLATYDDSQYSAQKAAFRSVSVPRDVQGLDSAVSQLHEAEITHDKLLASHVAKLTS